MRGGRMPYPEVLGYARSACRACACAPPPPGVRVASGAACTRTRRPWPACHALPARPALLVSAQCRRHHRAMGPAHVIIIRTLPNRDMLQYARGYQRGRCATSRPCTDMTSSQQRLDGNGDVHARANNLSDNHTEAYLSKDAAYSTSRYPECILLNAKGGMCATCGDEMHSSTRTTPERAISVNCIVGRACRSGAGALLSWEHAARCASFPAAEHQSAHIGTVIRPIPSTPVRIVPAHALF
uniref:Uncharacterized protein n=1 Tax=Heliothis virescens TaxID=7102 RepID=A0A2A4JD41_HELVI